MRGSLTERAGAQEAQSLLTTGALFFLFRLAAEARQVAMPAASRPLPTAIVDAHGLAVVPTLRSRTDSVRFPSVKM